jgi:hypothetical protein
VAEVHGLLARVTLVLVLMTAAWSGAILVTGRPIRPALVGGLVWVVLLLAGTALLGAVVAITAHAPKDPLHLVYGTLAVVVMPGAWSIARAGHDSRRRVIVLAAASVVQIILVVRLFQTGG